MTRVRVCRKDAADSHARAAIAPSRRAEAENGTSCTRFALLPLLDGTDQPVERCHTQHDDEHTSHFGLPQAEARVDHERVAQALAAIVSDSSTLFRVSRLRRGTENETCTCSRLPNCPGRR